jgi:hypothetical protein
LCTGLRTRLGTTLTALLTRLGRLALTLNSELRRAATLGRNEGDPMRTRTRVFGVHEDRPRVLLPLSHCDGARCGRVGREIRTRQIARLGNGDTAIRRLQPRELTYVFGEPNVEPHCLLTRLHLCGGNRSGALLSV